MQVPRRVLTETFLKSLAKRPPTKRASYTEPGRVGFQLRHEPGGTLAFYHRYLRDGRDTPMLIGNYPAMSLEEAHAAHAEARKAITRGVDLKAEREAAARARKAQEARERSEGAVGIRNVIAEFGWHYARKERKHPREAVRLLKVYLGKPWKGRPVRELVRRDAVLLLDRIKARAPVMANRVFNLGFQAFTFAVSRDLTQTNPFVGVGRPGGDEPPRDRHLNADEVRAFWRGLEDEETEISRPVALGLRLILVTAQRPGEVAGAKWSEFTDKVWTIPASRSKNGRAHEVPLTALARQILDELRGLAKDRPHLLPSVHSKLKRDEPLSQRAMSRALRNNHRHTKLFGGELFTPHDLRRTAASMMTSLGIPRLHVSKVLGHADQDITGAVYDQHDYVAEKKQALETWAQDLQAIITGKRRKVVPITAGRAA
jgi:integrase